MRESAAEAGHLGPDERTGRHRCRRRAPVFCFALPPSQPPLPGPAASLRQPNSPCLKHRTARNVFTKGRELLRTAAKNQACHPLPDPGRCRGALLTQAACMHEEGDTWNMLWPSPCSSFTIP